MNNNQKSHRKRPHQPRKQHARASKNRRRAVRPRAEQPKAGLVSRTVDSAVAVEKNTVEMAAAMTYLTIDVLETAASLAVGVPTVLLGGRPSQAVGRARVLPPPRSRGLAQSALAATPIAA